MKKMKLTFLVASIVVILMTVMSFGASAESEIHSEFDYKTGIVYVSGEGEIKDLYAPKWIEFEEDDCEHEAEILCDLCMDYRIRHIIIDEGITSIDHCFLGLGGLKTLSLPGTLKEIKGGSFVECYNLRTVVLPEGLTVIDNAFNCCTNLQWVNIPQNIEVLCGFGYSRITDLEIPRSVKKLAIASDYLKSIYIPETVTAEMLKAEGYVNEYMEDEYECTFSGIITKSKKLTVTGYDLSAAKEWAKANGHKFEEISPVPEKITVKNYAKHVLISWDAVEKTDTWKLYRQVKGSDTWKRVATLDGNTTSFKDTTAQYGKTYVYSLKGDDNKIYTKATIGRIAKPTDIVMYSTSASKATITWDKVSGAKYYYIYERFNNGGGNVYKKVAKVDAKNNYYNFTNIDYSYSTVHYYVVRAHDGTTLSAVSDAVEFMAGQLNITSVVYDKDKNTVTIKWITSAGIDNIDVRLYYYDGTSSYKEESSEIITVKASQLKKSGKYTYITIKPKENLSDKGYAKLRAILDVEYKDIQSSNKRPLSLWVYGEYINI